MADMGLTEVAAGVMAEISTMVQTELKQKAKLLSTVKQVPVGPGMGSVALTRAGGFTAADKAENTALTAQVITFAADTLALDKHKAVLVRLEDIAGLQFRPDVVDEIVSRMSSEMALQVDRDIYTELKLTSAAAPDHRLAYADTASLKKADLLAARALLHAQNVPFSECTILVSPVSEISLLAIDDFVSVDRYGSAQAIQNGELGRLYGAPVIWTNVAETAATIIYHPTHCVAGLQQNLTFERDRDLPNVSTLFLASQIYGTKVLDAGVRGVLLGSAA